MKFIKEEDTLIPLTSRDDGQRIEEESRHCYTQIRSSFYVTSTFTHPVSNTKPGAGCIDPRSQWNLGSVMIISISLVLLLALLPPSDASECTLKRSLHTVRFRRCVPKRVRSLNCHGACTSYSSLNPQNLFSIVRNCSCCKETGFRNGRIALRCPKPSGRRGYRTAYVRVKVPTGCSCRPCDSVPTIQPGEFL